MDHRSRADLSPQEAHDRTYQKGKKRTAKFPKTPKGRARFIQAVSEWMHSGEPLEDFFRENYNITQTAVYNTAQRLGLRIPTNRDLNRPTVLEEQREGRVPPEVIAARYGITTGTLRQWSSRFSMPLKGNTKSQRTAWWRTYFEGLDDLDNAFDYFKRTNVAPHLAIAAYHELFLPDHPICWDNTGDPPVVITDWEKEDFIEAVNATEAVPPHRAKLFIGTRGLVHYVQWPDAVEEEESIPLWDPNEITVDGEKVTVGAHLWLLTKSGACREVEYLGLQENQLAMSRDLETNVKRTHTPGALCLEKLEEGQIPLAQPVED